MKRYFIFLFLFSIALFSYANDENIFKVGIGAFKDELYMVAESQFKVIVEQYPNSRYFQDALYYLVVSQYRQKKYNEALSTISLIEGRYKYIKYFPKVVFIKGRILFEQQKYKDAIKIFSKYSSDYPIDEDAPFSLYYLGLSYYYLSNYDRAISILQSIERSYSNSPIIEEAKFKLAQINLEISNYNEAYVRFKEFERVFSNSSYLPEVYYSLGKVLFFFSSVSNYYTNFVYDSANYFLKSSEYQTYLRPYALFNAGVSFYNIGKFDDAKEPFVKLIEDYSMSADQNIRNLISEASYTLGKIFSTQNNITNAIKYYKFCVSYGGDFGTKSVIELSSLLNSIGATNEAISLLEQYTNDYLVLFNYANSIYDRKPEEADNILFSIITNSSAPTDVKDESIVSILKNSLKRGKYEFVIYNFNIFLTNSTSDFTKDFVYLALGEAQLGISDYKSAISSYSQVKNQKLKEDAIEGIAYTHFMMGNYDLSIKFYKELIDVYKSPKYYDRSRYFIGVAYERLKKPSESINFYTSLISDGKDIRYVLGAVVNLGWIYVREGKFDNALSLVNSYLSTAKQNLVVYQQLIEIAAWAYDGKKDYKNAINALYQIINDKDLSSVQKVRYLSYISLFYEKSNDLNKAIGVIENDLLNFAISRGLTNEVVDAIGRLVELEIKTGDDVKLKSYIYSLKREYTNFSKSYDYIYKYGEYLYAKEKYLEAADEFLFVARNSKDTTLSGDAYFWAGWSYYNAKNISKAVEIFDEFVSYSKSSKVPNVLLTLGDIMVNQKNISKAKEYYKRIVDEFKSSPEYSEAVLRLSKISSRDTLPKVSQDYAKSGQEKKQTQEVNESKNFESIVSSLEKLSSSSDKTTSSKAKFELAMIYKSQRDYQKAIDLLQQITEEVYNETAAMAQFEIAEILRINGDYNKAWKEYIKVVYIYKDFKDIVVKSMYYAIYCYIQIKDYEQAKKLYEKMYREFYKDPWTEKAKELVDKL
ncbi:MAG: tetratricopeptide repeat protein [Brevinematia bacterium]